MSSPFLNSPAAYSLTVTTTLISPFFQPRPRYLSSSLFSPHFLLRDYNLSFFLLHPHHLQMTLFRHPPLEYVHYTHFPTRLSPGTGPILPLHVIISDFFCTWTHKLSSCLRVPRVVFYPSAAFSSAVLYSMWGLAPNNPENDLNLEVVFDDVVGSPRCKWFELSFLFRSGKPGDPEWDIFQADMLSNLTSWGALFNTFSEMEKVYIDHFINKMGHNRVWAVGPLLQDDVAQEDEPQAQELMTWLNDKADCSVIYICFGSLTALTVEESTVLRAALEYSKVQFVWCTRETDGEEGLDINTVDCECDPNTAKNGLIVKGWAPQLAILGHRAIGGFVTHCGWNSIIESIWSGVVTVAWPMGADQYSNAQLVVDKLGLGFQVNCDGPMGVPDPQELGQLLVKSLSATQLERDRVIRLGKMAASTVKSGASGIDFDQFLSELHIRLDFYGLSLM